MKDYLSPKYVIKILSDRGFISSEQEEEILRKRPGLQKKLEQLEAVKRTSTSKVRIMSPVTIVDVIATLNLRRADNPERALDEDAIYQVLADEWKAPFKKVDPLKLDINLVTGTIPHSFAMKHLVNPIDKGNGVLTVATPNPFNVAVIEDLARVSHMKVQLVVTPKRDIVKLLNEFFGFKRSIAAAEDQFGGSGVDLGRYGDRRRGRNPLGLGAFLRPASWRSRVQLPGCRQRTRYAL